MNNLKDYRKKIDFIDKNIVKLILFRFDLVKKIWHYKKLRKLKIADKKREMEVINNIKRYSKYHQKFIINIFKKIIENSKKIQK